MKGKPLIMNFKFQINCNEQLRTEILICEHSAKFLTLNTIYGKGFKTVKKLSTDKEIEFRIEGTDYDTRFEFA